jgi:hypothetical protein
MIHTVIVSLGRTGRPVLDKNPLEVSTGDEIQWTSAHGDIRVELPVGLVSSGGMVTGARVEELTPEATVIATATGRVWYRYDVYLSSIRANAAPHVIVTGPRVAAAAG